MANKPGLVAVTKFVRAGSKTFSSYIGYMDRDEAVHGGNIRESYSAYSEMYMGNPEKTTGLFSADYDRLSPETAQIYKKEFKIAQQKNSLLWQTVISFDNKWLEELGLYDVESGQLDEARIRGVTRQFMSVLMDRENMKLSSWTAAIHYNTDNIHVHIAIVDPAGERELVKDGKYAGEAKGTWGIRSIRYAKSAAVNDLLELDQTMQQINQLIRTCAGSVSQKQVDQLFQKDLARLLYSLETNVPDMRNWKYGMSSMKPYRKEIDAITDKWLHEEHPQEYVIIRQLLEDTEKKQTRAYGTNTKTAGYTATKEAELYRRCGNAVLKISRMAEIEKRRSSGERPLLRVRNGHSGVAYKHIYKLMRAFNDEYRHYRNQTAFAWAQKQLEWKQEQQNEEQEKQIQEQLWIESRDMGNEGR